MAKRVKDLETVEAGLRVAEKAARIALERLEAAAGDYARAHAVAYSQAHPRRKITYCAAMGSTTLHVAKGGTCWGDSDYMLKAYDSDIGRPPAFLDRLAKVEQAFGFRHAIGGNMLLDIKGGKIMRDVTDW